MRRIVALAFIAGLAAAACSSGQAATPVATEAVGGDVFAGTVPGVAGTDIDLAAFAETDAVVWFWAPW